MWRLLFDIFYCFSGDDLGSHGLPQEDMRPCKTPRSAAGLVSTAMREAHWPQCTDLGIKVGVAVTVNDAVAFGPYMS